MRAGGDAAVLVDRAPAQQRAHHAGAQRAAGEGVRAVAVLRLERVLAAQVDEREVGVGAGLQTALREGEPARRFGLPKGRLEPGADADLALVDLRAEHAAEPLDRHRANPYAGRPLRASVVRTLLRGETIYDDGRVAPGAHGRLITPERSHP